jgi:hypothetical protein
MKIPAIATLLAIFSSANAVALDFTSAQVHGFASQGYLLSDGNNFYGDSQRGSTELTEIGLNANIRLNNQLNLSGQLLSRDAGGTDNDSLRVDFLFADYKAIENDVTGLGVRVGRVRNAYGLYNETRDVLFTRPSVLMPQAIYYEGNGLRELLFSSDGVQLYSYWDSESSTTSFSLTAGRNKRLNKNVVKNILGSASAQTINQSNINHPLFAQVAHSMSGGRNRFAFSMYRVDLDFETDFMGVDKFKLYANGYVLSAQHNTQKWSLTGEYSLTATEYDAGPLGNENAHIESAYIQADYRQKNNWTIYSRLEYSAYDRDDRNASDTQHLVFGTKWSPAANWMLAADILGMRGTGGVPPVDNPSGTNERTEMLVVMVGFRF